MLKLPVCPYCGTVYRYKDVWHEITGRGQPNKAGDRENTCYHCQKQFKIAVFPGMIVQALIWVVLSIITNLVLLSRMTELNIAVMMITTLLYAAVLILLSPFFVSYKKIENEKKKK